MLITRFHSLIRNKFVWAVVAIVVSVLFLLPAAGPGCDSSAATRAVGTINGRDISPEDFRTAVFFEMGLSEERGLTPEQYEQVRRQAWRRLAILDKAAELGITTPDEEIAQLLSREQGFLSNGVFDHARYDAFVTSRGVTIPLFERYLRENLTIQKAMGVLESMVWPAPAEISRRLRNLTDQRQVAYVSLEPQQFTGTVTVAEADARAFYEQNTNFFRIPERVRVQYVTFPHAKHAPESIEDGQIQDFYDLHVEDFTPESTNGESVLPLPLESVKDVIVERVRAEESRLQAREVATTFAMDLMPDRKEQRPSLESLAADRALAVETTGWFALDEPVPGLAEATEAEDEFRQAAFGLVVGDAELAFSDAVSGSNATYVLHALERLDSRVPPFEEIADRVQPAATTHAQRQAFLAWAQGLRDTLQADTETGKEPNRAAADQGMDVIMLPEFSVMESLSTNLFENADVIVPATVNLEAGEWGDLIEAADMLLIPCMLKRTPGDPSMMAALRPQMIGSLQEYQGGFLFREWGEYLLNEGAFKDFQEQLPEAGEDEEVDGGE